MKPEKMRDMSKRYGIPLRITMIFVIILQT